MCGLPPEEFKLLLKTRDLGNQNEWGSRGDASAIAAILCAWWGKVGGGWGFRARRAVEPMCKACIDSELFIQLCNSFLLLVCIHSVRSPLGVSILPPFDISEAGIIRCYWINGFAQGALSFE